MRNDVHVNWCMNVCQCVLCILSSLSFLLCIFPPSYEVQRGEVHTPGAQRGSAGKIRPQRVPRLPWSASPHSPQIMTLPRNPLFMHIVHHRHT